MEIERKLVIGLRTYLVQGNFKECEDQVEDARRAFPYAFIYLAACGLPPSEKMRATADEVTHYSTEPLGLGVPNKLIIEKALAEGALQLVIVDGDRQHFMATVKDLLDKYGQRSVAVIPERKKRFLFSREELHGPTVEDLLNGFLRLSFGCNLKDPAPGLYLFPNARTLSGFKFNAQHSWVGDAELVKNVFTHKLAVESPEISVREKTYSISRRDLVFNSFLESEKFFGVTLAEVAEFIKTHPEESLFGGNFFEIDRTVEAFGGFRSQLKIKGMKALVLAGGKGTRLKPFTHTIQKQLFPIANKPVLHYIIEKIVRAGIREIGVIVGPNKDQVKNALGDGSKWNCSITYIDQDDPAGLAHAVLTAKDFLGESSFLMYLGDNLLRDELGDFLKEFVDSSFAASLTLKRVANPANYGIAEIDSHGRIVRLLEKPKNPPSDLAIVGIYAFTHKIFGAIGRTKPSARGELEITDAIQQLCEKKENINYRIIDGWWEDTGTPESLLDANVLILSSAPPTPAVKGKVSKTAVVKGGVEIGEGTVIEGDCVLLGPSVIGAHCVIGSGALIGPYSSIGDNCSIRNAQVLGSIVLEDTAIDCTKQIIFSVIGKNCRITSDSPSKGIDKVTLRIGDDTSIKV